MSEIAATSPTSEQRLVVIGDIVISRSWIVTPNGTRPLKDTQIFVTDMTRTESKIPGWAIVLAIIFAFFFLLGLLLLLVKETTITGAVQVSVHNGTLVHATQLPVSGPGAIQEINGRVNYARQLIATAP